jgi:hypothetical protein
MAMNRLIGLFLFGTIISWQVFSTQRAPAHLKGIVVAEDGMPISGVRIFAQPDGTTDADGRFDLLLQSEKEQVIYFQKEGFRPKAVVIKSESSMLKVVLEDDRKTAWFVPVCALKDTKTSPKGYELSFLLPKGASTKKLKDIDYHQYLVTFRNRTAPLQLWWGGLVQPGQLISDLILRSANFEERSIRSKSGEYWGCDRQGKSQDGMHWRAAGFAGLSGAATYEDVTDEIAKAYDRIIDSACQADISPKF